MHTNSNIVYRVIHSFTCAGILPSQYHRFSLRWVLMECGTSLVVQVIFLCCVVHTSYHIYIHLYPFSLQPSWLPGGKGNIGRGRDAESGGRGKGPTSLSIRGWGAYFYCMLGSLVDNYQCISWLTANKVYTSTSLPCNVCIGWLPTHATTPQPRRFTLWFPVSLEGTLLYV